jgi:hypothetical protein
MLHVGTSQCRTTEQDGDVRQAACVHLLEVLPHDESRLDEQAAHADRVGAGICGGVEHLGEADLDAEIANLVPVVGEDDVHEVLPDVVDVALHRGQHDSAPASLIRLLHQRLEVGHRGLHGLGGLQHEGKLHLARGEEVADRLHAREKHVVHDLEGGVAGRERLVEIGLDTVAIAVDYALLQPSFDGPVGPVLGCRAAGGRSFKQRDQLP